MPTAVSSPAHDAAWERVCRIFEEWTERLEMSWLTLTLVRSDAVHEEESTYADTNAQWQYRQAQIRVFLPMLVALTDGQIEAIIVHELVHVLVNPMASLLKDKDSKLAELAVENVAQALLAAAAVKGPKAVRSMKRAA